MVEWQSYHVGLYYLFNKNITMESDFFIYIMRLYGLSVCPKFCLIYNSSFRGFNLWDFHQFDDGFFA